MRTITMNNTAIFSNETTTLITLIMNKNQSTATTINESSSLDDLCKNFHVSSLLLSIKTIIFINHCVLFSWDEILCFR
jgi:hypothetical protein